MENYQWVMGQTIGNQLGQLGGNFEGHEKSTLTVAPRKRGYNREIIRNR